MQEYTIITNSTTTEVTAHHYARNKNGDFLLFEDDDTREPLAEFPINHCEGISKTEFIEGVAR